jgi:hypothetical protein
VEGHRFKIMQKLKLEHFSQLVLYGIEHEF